MLAHRPHAVDLTLIRHDEVYPPRLAPARSNSATADGSPGRSGYIRAAGLW